MFFLNLLALGSEEVEIFFYLLSITNYFLSLFNGRCWLAIYTGVSTVLWTSCRGVSFDFKSELDRLRICLSLSGHLGSYRNLTRRWQLQSHWSTRRGLSCTGTFWLESLISLCIIDLGQEVFALKADFAQHVIFILSTRRLLPPFLNKRMFVNFSWHVRLAGSLGGAAGVSHMEYL